MDLKQAYLSFGVVSMANMSESEGSLPLIAVTAAVGAIVLLFTLLCSVFRKDKPKEEIESEQDKKTANAGSEKNNSNKKVKPATKTAKKPAHISFSHTWLSCTLKGHSSRIVSLDFSPNGKYLITASEDRALMLWSVKEFRQKEHKYIRGNVEFDSATHVAFSPDSRALVASLANENAVRIFRLGKKDDGSHNVTISGALDFPSKHKLDIIGVGISSSGKWIMTCSSDTTILIWDLKGEVLATIDTHQVNNSCGKVSPCGRFVASSGFTSDVKVWEVVFDKSGSFSSVKRAFELKGHSAGVYDFDFNNDSRRMASVSKDNTWKVWDTDVRYDMGQDPKLLYSGKVSYPGPALIALSPDGRTVAVGVDTSIAFWDAANEHQDQVLENVHAESMSCLKFDIGGRYLVCSGGKHVQVLHNVTGYKATIADLEEKLRTASGPGMKDRLKQQVSEAKEALENILLSSKDSPK
ncbi:transducin beta-like protein 2 [Elysia marginata]|uniref:Transducin beta-like protein 2 n=1 Tax=Elysia marginata TaxID=1093978 RepID=A0AAV4HFW1_9GAST|nr:transducin beta-like protein 2 [Elysia marginata]